MKSMSAFLCKLILYGYVYDVDYSYLRNYNTELGRISSNLNQIAKRVNSTGNIYQEDIDEVKELMNEVFVPYYFWHYQSIFLIYQINFEIRYFLLFLISLTRDIKNRSPFLFNV